MRADTAPRACLLLAGSMVFRAGAVPEALYITIGIGKVGVNNSGVIACAHTAHAECSH